MAGITPLPLAPAQVHLPQAGSRRDLLFLVFGSVTRARPHQASVAVGSEDTLDEDACPCAHPGGARCLRRSQILELAVALHPGEGACGTCPTLTALGDQSPRTRGIPPNL